MMAQAKKMLTAEEKLTMALVPAEEQPYEIPKNWCWVYLLQGVATCLDSFRKPVNATERAKRLGNIPYYGATGQVGWIDDYLTDEQLVLIGEDGAPFLDPYKPKAFLIEGKAWINNHAHILKSFWGNIGNLYLMNYLNTFNYHEYVNGTTRLKLTQGKMKKIPVPLPPLAEQQRIVARIEEFFRQLDEAEERIQHALDSLAHCHTSLLRDAFSGNLTSKWRKKYDNGYKHWESGILSKYLKNQENRKPNGQIFRYIDIESIDNKKQIVRAPKILRVEDAPSRANRKLHADDIIFSMVRPYLKNIAYIDKYMEDCIASTGFYVCTCKDALFPKFLYYLLCADKTIHYLMQFMKGDNSPSIRKNFLLDMPISLPPLEEQKEIVRILDEAFAREDEAREAAERALAAIPKLRRAILARAFRGQLSTGDPSDEDARALLVRTL